MTTAIHAPRVAEVPKPWDVLSLSKHWGCSTTMVYGLIESGNLPAFKLGGKLIRISRQAVDDYESASAIPSSPKLPTLEVAQREALAEHVRGMQRDARWARHRA